MGCSSCGHCRCEENDIYTCKKCKRNFWLCGGANHTCEPTHVDGFCCCGCADGIDLDNYICNSCLYK